VHMTANGRKQTLRLSLDECSFTSALEKKADIRVLELRAKANGRNRPKAVVRQTDGRASAASARIILLQLE